jgi:hypothetical protein
MPKGFLAVWPLLGHSGVVQGFRDRANGIDGAPHGHLQTLGIRQGEIDSAASAVGRRVGSALAGSSPKTTHLSGGFRAPAGVLDWIHAPPQALLVDGMVHHEGLYGNGPPGIKDSEAPLRLLLLQDPLGLKQAINNPLAQAKGRPPRAIGST